MEVSGAWTAPATGIHHSLVPSASLCGASGGRMRPHEPAARRPEMGHVPSCFCSVGGCWQNPPQQQCPEERGGAEPASPAQPGFAEDLLVTETPQSLPVSHAAWLFSAPAGPVRVRGRRPRCSVSARLGPRSRDGSCCLSGSPRTHASACVYKTQREKVFYLQRLRLCNTVLNPNPGQASSRIFRSLHSAKGHGSPKAALRMCSPKAQSDPNSLVTPTVV